VSKGRWRVLVAAQRQVDVSLFHHHLMGSNWTWACDVYVPEDVSLAEPSR
jgi:hypothetical protein